MTSWRDPQEVEYLLLFDRPIPLPIGRVLVACHLPGPYVHYFYANNEDNPKYRKCNRPSGHEGNHMFSTRKDGPIAEWTRDGQKVRP